VKTDVKEKHPGFHGKIQTRGGKKKSTPTQSTIRARRRILQTETMQNLQAGTMQNLRQYAIYLRSKYTQEEIDEFVARNLLRYRTSLILKMLKSRNNINSVSL
jgi:hypothetical protein